MFKIESVDILPSQVGKGLQIGDAVIGCARITEISLPEGATLKQVAEADGLVLGYKMGEPSKVVPNQRPNVEFNTKDLSTADNYVLVIIKDDETTVVTHGSQITELFDLPEEDAEQLMLYIGDLAKSRNLSMITTEDLDESPFIFFVNAFDETMMDFYLNNNQEALFQQYMGLMHSPEFLAEMENHNFIKMFLVGLVKASQDRYNSIHRDKVLCDLAKELCNIRYWNDGKLLKPSVKDIEDFMNEMKNQIVVQ